MRKNALSDNYRDLLLAAWFYANSRSQEDRAIMLSLGNSFWDGFPAFLMEMKEAIRTGRSKEFLRHDDVKHMYALLFMSILNGLDTDYLDRVGSALLAAASPRKVGTSGKPRALATSNSRALATP